MPILMTTRRSLILLMAMALLGSEGGGETARGESETFLSNGVTAHRGNSGEFAENTWPAFRSAIDLGVDWIELDIFRTSDGRRIASVSALPKDGYQVEPFCVHTHGGPMQTSHTQVPLPRLFNVHSEGENHANRFDELYDAQFCETPFPRYDC